MAKKGERQDGRHEPDFWCYELADGWQALAGKTAADNDRLTFRTARPTDLWFHLKGMPGSHVILTGGESDKPDKDTIKQAAAIAAYHSKARNAGQVAVTFTLARDIRKPKGAPLGTVVIRNEKVVKVRPALP